jgi:hypothetical protein
MRENREASETPAAQPGRRFGGRRPEPRGSLFALFATVRQQTIDRASWSGYYPRS